MRKRACPDTITTRSTVKWHKFAAAKIFTRRESIHVENLLRFRQLMGNFSIGVEPSVWLGCELISCSCNILLIECARCCKWISHPVVREIESVLLRWWNFYGWRASAAPPRHVSQRINERDCLFIQCTTNSNWRVTWIFLEGTKWYSLIWNQLLKFFPLQTVTTAILYCHFKWELKTTSNVARFKLVVDYTLICMPK